MTSESTESLLPRCLETFEPFLSSFDWPLQRPTLSTSMILTDVTSLDVFYSGASLSSTGTSLHQNMASTRRQQLTIYPILQSC